MTGDLLARIEAERKRYDDERADNRKRFPYAMELLDPVRDAGLAPKLRHATNANGDSIGRPPALPGIGVDGDKLARLPEYLTALRELAPKNWNDPRAYNARASRCIKPNPWRADD
ncbi:MAG: hypothetical protein GAK28_03206 [Luteibacter sp.]|uniref:hypothetical protein n=1 Tax=Luteibacter sp. TaxID=1886636 RepID=UPI0013830D73|nr:hypothetical protein [Luteibacter sp.]KAF1005454.1 MAG: hypothetical protein GAK28_03206 [Luteibacter sp.]